MGQIFVKASRRAKAHVRRLSSGHTTKLVGTKYVKGQGYKISVKEGWKGRYSGKVHLSGTTFHPTRAGARKDVKNYVKELRRIGYK